VYPKNSYLCLHINLDTNTMNRLTRSTFLLLLTCGFSISSCLEDEPGKNRNKVTYVEMTVAAETVEEEYYPFLSGTPFLREFL
ncbi:MAG: hypothetical protein LUD15_09430, partial [Bacteroides sp.]|nr:hypothetical protein [Bacteroides sp.]